MSFFGEKLRKEIFPDGVIPKYTKEELKKKSREDLISIALALHDPSKYGMLYSNAIDFVNVLDFSIVDLILIRQEK